MNETDARLAARIAERAGRLLLDLQAGSGLSGKELGKAGDRQANELLLRELAEARPGDAVLSEESADSPARLTANRVWIIDPLDGTREYGMPGRPDWAVHVALWQRGVGPAGAAVTGSRGAITDAAVAQPALDAVYATDASATDSLATDSLAVADAAPAAHPRLLVSDSRPPSWAQDVADAVGGELVGMGSAGAKAMAVLRGEAEAYLHAGGQWEWDSAAPVGVVLAAGLHASRIDGGPLEYNVEHPYLPDLLICRADLADPLLREIESATGG